MAGWQIGNYVIDDPAGFDHGNFGTLYHACHVTTGAKVALKLVRLTSAADSRERLEAERRGATLQQRFEQKHGLVPKVYEFDEFGQHFYIAMEFVQGDALTTLIRTGPVPPDTAARHAVSICDFLDKAHSFETTIDGKTYRRIVHADLKPAHVLLPAPGEIKVLDFGIAKALETASLGTTINWSTPHYASPERLDLVQANEHVDFWSLGVMLYELVSGHRPYSRIEAHDTSDYRRLRHAITSNAPRESLPDTCPAALAAIIDKLLAYSLARRYPSAAAIRYDLQAFLDGRDPAALKEYATPATLPIPRDAAAVLPQPVTVAPPVNVVPPTDPLPMSSTLPAAASATAVADRPAVRRSLTRVLGSRVTAVAVMLILVGMTAREGVALLAAERFRARVQGLDGATLASRRLEYDGIDRWGVFDIGLRVRVNGPLRKRLIALADPVIEDYRRERPSMGVAQWRQANDALAWALSLSPDDAALRAKQQICEGHLARLAARTAPRGSDASRQAYRTAIAKFRNAAALDDSSYDPYIAMSNIQLYGLDALDEATAAVAAAEKRGFVPGRRERAMIGDGYLRRAQKSRRLAEDLTGEQRRRELESARTDYGQCIAAFDPIIGFGNAAANLELCKRLLESVSEDLAIESEADIEPAADSAIDPGERVW